MCSELSEQNTYPSFYVYSSAELLQAWTESSGRIGVADVRTMFGSRQLILINTSDVNVERVQISEGSGQRTGYRSARHDLGSTPDYLGLDAERRNLDAERQQLRNLTRGMLDRRRDEELGMSALLGFSTVQQLL